VTKEKLDILREHCEREGRDFNEIRRSTSLNVYPIAKGADPEKATEEVRKNLQNATFEKFNDAFIVGESEMIIERIGQLKDVGADYIINYIPGVAYDHEPMQRYNEEVIPAFAG
jgi:alkanesulfonate monooxygenase SsuD/methylene tetrahydromethanopterin reductase-like flavin-dependent oxidoreductase (luciferase family)